jgi:predicted DNA repair protein MutK
LADSQGVKLNEQGPGQTGDPGTEPELRGPLATVAGGGSETRGPKGILGLILNNPAGAIYGTIAVGALLAAESVRRETYARNVVAVVITLVLYWLAHSYADLAGERLRSGARLTLGRLGRTMLYELPLLVGATIPLGTLLICWVAGTRLSAAVIAALWTSAAIVVMIELSAGVRGRLAARQLVAQALIGALLGALVIFLRVVLH